MNNIFILIFSLLTLLNAEDKFLFDLGITIKSKEINKNTEFIKPLISNTKISPVYNNNQINLVDKNNWAMEPKHIIKILYLNNQYFELTKYIQNLKNNDSFKNLNDEQLLIYANALSQVGDYNDAIKNINLLSDGYPNDERYFLLALYNKKAGNVNNAIDLLHSLITKYPNSEYIKLAKLQAKELR